MEANTSVSPLFVKASFFNIILVDHTGLCGYICLALLLGFKDWIAIINLFHEKKESPYFTDECRERIDNILNLIASKRKKNESVTSLDDELYLTTAMGMIAP